MLKGEFERGGPLQHILLRYIQALITQMAQTAVCNRRHAVEQQLCRSLLLSLDRLSSNELIMTQEQISNMLGVRREGVTEAAGKLRAAGLINYSRGKITVRQRGRHLLPRLAIDQLQPRQDHGAGPSQAGRTGL